MSQANSSYLFCSMMCPNIEPIYQKKTNRLKILREQLDTNKIRNYKCFINEQKNEAGSKLNYSNKAFLAQHHWHSPDLVHNYDCYCGFVACSHSPVVPLIDSGHSHVPHENYST